ncbi:MAG: hypothetical protein U0136_20580 [Bdellovibrionota bacterium]
MKIIPLSAVSGQQFFGNLMDDRKPRAADDSVDEVERLLFGDDAGNDEGFQPLEGLSLDHFLRGAEELRQSTERALFELTELPEPIVPKTDPVAEGISLLKESLSQYSHVQSAKMDSLSNDFRDAVDVIDGRIALATRVLSERQDGCTVSLTQIERELSLLQEGMARMQSDITLLASHEEPDLSDVQLLEQQEALYGRVDSLTQEFAEMLEGTSEALARRQQDVDARLARLETAINRLAKPPRRFKNLSAWMIVALLLANAGLMAWIQFWR